MNLMYIVSHPIQYQAPLLKQLAEHPDVYLLVVFRSDYSLHKYLDKGFGRAIEWDVPLVEGYQYKVLPALGKRGKVGLLKPFNYGLKKIFKEFKPDVVWLHGYATWLDWYVMGLAKLKKAKVMVRGESTLFACSQSVFRSCLRRGFFKLLDKMVDGFLTIGTANQKFYEHYDIDKRKCFLAPYTVNNTYFRKQAEIAKAGLAQLRQKLGITYDWPVVLYASKLIPRKRADDLLEAFIQLSEDGKTPPESYLLIVGDGELMPRLKRRLSQLNWPNIKLLGFKNQSELPAYFQLSDIFVLPSKQEPWGLVINECMNAECALLASNEVGSAYDLIQEEENGYVFEAGNITDLKNKLKRLLDKQEQLSAMKQASVEKIEKWGLEDTAEGIVNAARLLMERKTSWNQ